MKTRTLLLACLWLVVSSCAAQIDQKMKTPVMMSPEALGGWPRAEVGAGYIEAPLVSITDDARNNPPDQATSRVVRQDRIFLYGGVGLLQRLDVSLDPASWLNLKLQLIGTPFVRSKRGNFAFSVFASGWTEKDNGRGSDLDLKDNNQLSIAPDVRYTKKLNAWRAGALAGFRVLDPVLIYGGWHQEEFRYSGDYSIVNGPRGRYAGYSTASVISAGLEVAFAKSFVLRIEDSYSVVRVPAFGARSSGHYLGLLLAGVLGGTGN